jgi:hypothetical protein
MTSAGFAFGLAVALQTRAWGRRHTWVGGPPGQARRAYRLWMDLLLPLVLSGVGVAVAALAICNRAEPAWQRNMTVLMAIAIGQVVLGAVSWMLLSH